MRDVKSSISKVDEHIYLGSNQCCTTERNYLAELGIDANIQIEDDRVDENLNLPLFLRLPIKDDHAPSQNQLLVTAKFIDACVQQEMNVFVHCQNGHGRSPTIIMGYYIYKKLSFEEAYAKVKKGRGEIHLVEPQIKALKEFAQ